MEKRNMIMERMDEKTRLKTRLERYLDGKEFGFNPEPGVVDQLLEAMIKRRERFGDYYCPCRVVSGDKKRDEDIICPCIHHLGEIADQGFCHCRLFAGFRAPVV